MRGIDLGIIVALVVATAGGTAYLVRLEGRMASVSSVSTGSLPAGTLVRHISGRGCPDKGDWEVVELMVAGEGSRYYCEKQRPTE